MASPGDVPSDKKPPRHAAHETPADDDHDASRAHYLAGRQPVPRKWYAWFADTDSPAERRLVAKLDLLILSFAFLAYWAKYIDQGNLANAYISGLRDDLGFHGNELVHLQTVFNVAYTVFMVPLTVLAAAHPRAIPLCELAWGLATLLQYRARSFGELAAYRFLTGLFESAFFTSIHYILGSWYRPDELGRRAGFFYLATCLGTMTTGFLASGIVAPLDGRHGLAGWRWLYIVCAPTSPSPATACAASAAGPPSASPPAPAPAPCCAASSPAGTSTSSAPFLVPWILTCQPAGNGAYTLWIQSLHRYPTARLNQLTAVHPGVGLALVLFYSFLADLLQTKLPIILFQALLQFALQLAFPLWHRSSVGYKWAAVATGYGQNALSYLLYAWANDICREDADERAFVLAAMCCLSNVFATWVPLLVWRTVDAPEYHTGYLFTQVFIVVFALYAVGVWWSDRRDQQRIRQKVAVVQD